jgi:hypothetical protein
MRTTRAVAATTAVITAVLGLSLATAGSAAADPGTWRPYGKTNPITSGTSTWHCGATKAVATNVVAQVCVIRARDGVSAQAAVIVRNNRPSLFTIDASTDLLDGGVPLSGGICPSSGIAAKSWSVCFAPTIVITDSVYSIGAVGSVYLGRSPNA